MNKRRTTASILLLLALSLGEAAAKEVTVPDINERPSKWWHKQVTLQGDVEKIYPGGAFVFEGEQKKEDGDHHKNQILVIPRKRRASGETVQGREPPKSGDEVRVTGIVNQVTKENITKYYGPTIPPDLKVAIKGSMPVIIAQNITPSG